MAVSLSWGSHSDATPGPFVIIGMAGDSNGMWGKYLDPAVDVAGPRIYQLRNDYVDVGTIDVANEPLSNLGYGPADGQPGQVGNIVALCRELRDRGWIPNNYDILIVPRCMAGTAFLNYWAVTPAYNGTGGDNPGTAGRQALQPFINSLNRALTLGETPASNYVWFFSWDHGMNDGGLTEIQYQAHMEATWGEIRSTIPTAADVPILVTGVPPNAVSPGPGGRMNMGGVIAALENVESYLPDAIFIETSDLTSIDTSNGYVHHTAVTHRGGTNNAPGNTGEVVTDPISARKLRALEELWG